MSDAPQGPGWWQASDGKWYPPEQQPAGPPTGGPVQPAGGGTDIGAALGYGWNKFIQNIGDWIIFWLVFVGLVIVAAVLSFAIVAGSTMGGLSFNFVGIILGTLFGAAQGVLFVVLAKAALMVTNGERPEVGRAFQLTSNNIIAGVIFGLILGFLGSFCFVFGIVAWILLGYYPLLSADKDVGADGLSEAMNMSTSRLGEVFVLLLVAWLISGICGLGAPIAILALAYSYRTLNGQPVAP